MVVQVCDLLNLFKNKNKNKNKIQQYRTGGTVAKESACQCKKHKRLGLDPWVRKLPWRRKWQPAPVFLLGDSTDRAAWRATVHGVAKSRT